MAKQDRQKAVLTHTCRRHKAQRRNRKGIRFQTANKQGQVCLPTGANHS